LRETGEEPIFYTQGHFYNFTSYKIIKILIYINDRLLSR